jgi:hypothetical protein
MKVKNMKFRDFCYWLQGHLELKNKDDVMSFDQIEIIQQHLNLVLNKHPQMALYKPNNYKFENSGVSGASWSAIPTIPTGPIGPTGPTIRTIPTAYWSNRTIVLK